VPWGTCPRPRIPRDAARASQLGGATGYQLQRCLASPHPIIVVAPNQASSASLCKRSRLWAIHTTANLPIEMSDRACVFLSRRARAYPVSTFVPKTQPAAMRMTSRDGTCAWVFCGYRHVNRGPQDRNQRVTHPKPKPLLSAVVVPVLVCDGARSQFVGAWTGPESEVSASETHRGLRCTTQR
jgi:hypothetical protein